MRRALLGVAVTALVLFGLLALLVRWAAAPLQQRIADALGPHAVIASTSIGWQGVELRGLKLPAVAVRGWPAADELRAERVLIVPDLRSLWGAAAGGAWRVARIEVEGGYLSLLRTSAGTLRVLPSLLERSRPAGTATSAPQLRIGEVKLAGTSIDFHDASLGGRAAPYRLSLQALDATLGPLQLPALDEAVAIELSALLKGPRHDGRIALHGRLTPSTRDAALDVQARGVDLVALQPYLLKATDAAVKSGQLDLDLKAGVHSSQLHAPGSVTLRDLELASGGGLLDALAGVPRQAVLAAMKRDGRIVVRFTLEGRLDDPAFSINDNLATRVAGGLAESVGVSVGGAVEGVGSVIKGLLGR